MNVWKLHDYVRKVSVPDEKSCSWPVAECLSTSASQLCIESCLEVSILYVERFIFGEPGIEVEYFNVLFFFFFF